MQFIDIYDRFVDVTAKQCCLCTPAQPNCLVFSFYNQINTYIVVPTAGTYTETSLTDVAYNKDHIV